MQSTSHLISRCLEIGLPLSRPPQVMKSCTLLPDTIGSLQVLTKSMLDTESVKCPIFLNVNGWHKDRVECILLGSHLRKEAYNLVNSVTPELENLR